MSDVQHKSIGENSRKEVLDTEHKEARKKELIDRYTATPFRSFTIDQVSVWALWLTLAASVFLFCTVSAVMLAVR